GDVGAGNFLTLDGEVTAMLDWELAHLGDPHEDLAWLWMRGAHTSFGDPETRFAEYEAASGLQVDRARLAWHVAFVMWKSITSLHGRLRAAVPGELAMVQLIVALTYDALLGTQLVRVLGGSLPLLQQAALRTHSVEANLAEELLGVARLAPDQRVVLEYLRNAAALAQWQARALADECRTQLGIEPEQLLQHVQHCPSEQLPAVAAVLTRDADRRATGSPKSVRRIERAQRIGLGTA
ncbi:MAG: phosphotransferase, partial [Actinomycetota bacterium]|nr:phosphotransferase [Actinomycetota bacterium]